MTNIHYTKPKYIKLQKVLADAKNNRHIIALKDASFIMEWAHILKEEFGPKHYRIATTKAPNFLIRFSSIFDRTIKTVNA